MGNLYGGGDGGRHAHANCGIWLLASYMNHSCAGNSKRSFVGDMQILRATTDIPAGTELLFAYKPPQRLESYADVQKVLNAGWNFTCDCQLCRDKQATSKDALKKRAALVQQAGTILRGPRPINTSKVLAIVQKMEETYPETNGSHVRLELTDPYFAVATQLLLGKPTEAVKVIVKGLEALGFSITADTAAAKGLTPQLEVERWGLATRMVPSAFIMLFKAYKTLAPELCSRAKKYAEVAYSIEVGHKDGMAEMLPVPI
ncbi:SET domain-containing protein [Candidatus Bathyarchaeota archaeon]|nr:SET domain-containing protein [Candidatus Bathyarchaeota archaeon]